MAKRAKLLDNMRVKKAAEAPAMDVAPPAEVQEPAPPAADIDMRVTSIHIPRSLLRLLRMAAADRADRQGGRPSAASSIWR